MLENIKARIYAKPYDIYKEEVVKSGNEGYYLYNDTIYYGLRWLVFIVSGQNSWYQEEKFMKQFRTKQYKKEIS